MSGSGGEVFRSYAKFYDAIYADKDYEAECRFVEALLAYHGVAGGSAILDLGCGTGGHVLPLARAGWRITGVDRSEDMLAIARRKLEAAGATAEFIEGDIRTLRLGRTFGAVISMFAVVGYQLTNQDLTATFRTARAHLAPGGIFTFDAWFGPAVLTERPEAKAKTVREPDGRMLTRVATPTLDVVAQTVRVEYELTEEGAIGETGDVVESHAMRFLFAQETAYFLEVAGLEVVGFMPFMHPCETPTEHDWNVTWVARAI